MNKGSVLLNFRDVRNRLLRDEQVELFFDNKVEEGRDRNRDVHFKGRMKLLKNLPANPNGQYQLLIEPTAYRHKSRFVSIQPGEDDPQILTERFFFDPDKVEPVFPTLDEELFQALAKILEGSPVDYAELGSHPEKRAGLLNLHAKMQSHKVGGQAAFMSVKRIDEVRSDRIFAWVDGDLLKRAEKDTRNLHAADGSLHEYKDFRFLHSFKSFELAGNVQYTFFEDHEGTGNGPPGTLLCDCDIDDNQGLAHVFDVIGHHLTGGGTHPYDIHQVLWTQRIDPGYELVKRPI